MTKGRDKFQIVFVELLGEGVDVWRPVSARSLETGFELLEPADYDPSDEEWRFPPGSVVYVEKRKLHGGLAQVATSLVEES